MEKWICLDCETTGIDPEKDEILSLSIMDQDGEVLFDEMIKPLRKTYFPRATAVNGISYDDVKDKPSLIDFKKRLIEIFKNYNVVIGYNVGFDLGFLSSLFDFYKNYEIIDVMEIYSNYRAEPTEYGGLKWFKLEACASDLGYKSDNFHNSLEDVKATIYCFNKLKGKLLC